MEESKKYINLRNRLFAHRRKEGRTHYDRSDKVENQIMEDMYRSYKRLSLDEFELLVSKGFII